MTADSATKTALFVDFENVFSGFTDREAAKAFATEPARWVKWLEQGGDRSGGPGRRFLIKVCYLNPQQAGDYRKHFVSSGFRVVDCPTLTGGGKNSADIHLVIDALDALASSTRYDEFVIASADADFTPLLHRLRANDRRTTVLRAGKASASYLAVCDRVIQPTAFAAAALGARRGASEKASPAAALASVPEQSQSDRSCARSG